MRTMKTQWHVRVFVHSDKWVDYGRTDYRSNANEIREAACLRYPDKEFGVFRVETETRVIEVREDD